MIASLTPSVLLCRGCGISAGSRDKVDSRAIAYTCSLCLIRGSQGIPAGSVTPDRPRGRGAVTKPQHSDEERRKTRERVARHRRHRRGWSTGDRVIKKRGGNCLYCGGPAWTLDHVTPFCFTSDNSDENLVPACGLCNAVAGGKVFNSFEEKKSYILDRRAERSGLISARCPNGCGVTYAAIGKSDRCPDCGEAL